MRLQQLQQQEQECLSKCNCSMSWYKDKNRSIIGYSSFSKRHCANRSYIIKELLRSSKKHCDGKSCIVKGLPRSNNKPCNNRSYIVKGLLGSSNMYYNNKRRSMNIRSALQFSKCNSFLKLCSHRP